MTPFKMIIVCYQCYQEGDLLLDGNSIELDPLPIFYVRRNDSHMISDNRQKELIERHGWTVDGAENAFCSAECANDYYKNLRIQEREDMTRDGDL